MSDFIDLSDLFAHFDRSISIYNFLQFSSSQWKWIDNSIQPQSRLRMFQYQQIFSDLKIPLTQHTFRKGNTETLNSVFLVKEYSGYDPNEIATSHCHFISKIKAA